MTVFNLNDIITSANGQQNNDFTEHLRSKLGSSDDDDDDNDNDETYSNVQHLFSNAAQALHSELQLADDQENSSSTTTEFDDISAHAHWIPGRIEVMGKHTDYAVSNEYLLDIICMSYMKKKLIYCTNLTHSHCIVRRVAIH